ncbi:type-1 angiotensin II receptor-associated protein-like [Babylonia areolata]|uniref:type-1 angiotensin II receptor-associated protein-like n=1 Tax=Babylonia areolata TaxID=304850 RepID=UPI003FD46126
MNSSNLMVKIIVLVHFFLSVWGSMGNFMPSTYIYVNAGVAACGLWAVAQPESSDAVVMTLAVLVFSILEDIVLLALYEPRGYTTFERHESGSLTHEYRFALGMSIANLILKPFTAALLYRVLQARVHDSDFTIPGIDRLPGVGGGLRGGYSDIDHSPESAPYTPAAGEQPAPHDSADKE